MTLSFEQNPVSSLVQNYMFVQTYVNVKLPKNTFIIWPAPRADKMNQIPRCDWLPERVRWSSLARSGLPVASRKKTFHESHIINPLLTKLVRSRWLDIGLVLYFCEFMRLGPQTRKRRTWPISSHLDSTLGQ